MSIATEIERLQKAKADIKNAIEEKGVEVGDGSLDTYAEKINAITGDDIHLDSMSSYYDTIWDTAQQNGNRTDYKYTFAGPAWDKDTLKDCAEQGVELL